jgi:hypothetical protein
MYSRGKLLSDDKRDAVSILAELASRAADTGLRYILIGGNAVVAHGYPRQTQDFDLLVREPDRRAWDTLMVSLGYRAHHLHRAFHMYAPPAPPLPPIDFMLVDAQTFERLESGSQEIEINTTVVRIPSLAHLIALKLHAIKHGGEHRKAIDLSDVIELVRHNQVNLAAAPYSEILERYASANTRNELAILVPGAFRPGTSHT